MARVGIPGFFQPGKPEICGVVPGKEIAHRRAGEYLNDGIQLLDVQATFLAAFVSFLESRGKFQMIVHLSKAFFSSSMLSKLGTVGSCDIRLASAIASNVLCEKRGSSTEKGRPPCRRH